MIKWTYRKFLGLKTFSGSVNMTHAAPYCGKMRLMSHVCKV